MKILNFSEGANLALHAMIILSTKKDELFSLSRLADILQSSDNHLSKILQRLVKSNYIKSIRGPKGGYIYSEINKEKTLLEVLEVIDGKFQNNNCMFKRDFCIGNSCFCGEFLDGLNNDIRTYFSSYKLGDFNGKQDFLS